jgi:hypothetical protein
MRALRPLRKSACVIRTPDPQSLPAPPRVRWDAIVQLGLAAAGAGLAIAISYGFNVEYADIADSDASIAARSFADWWIGLVVVFAFAAGAVAAARRSRGRRVMFGVAAVIAVVSVIGIPAGAVVGMHEKFDRYPDQPSCTSAFNGGGSAVPVVRAAQDRFVELDHPGPFSGSGASGVDGCAAELLVGDAEVTATYRRTLVENGWRIDRYNRSLVSATKDGQAFEATQRTEGSWWVWIGPEGQRAPRP